jgi:hypothetical protein
MIIRQLFGSIHNHIFQVLTYLCISPYIQSHRPFCFHLDNKSTRKIILRYFYSLLLTNSPKPLNGKIKTQILSLIHAYRLLSTSMASAYIPIRRTSRKKVCVIDSNSYIFLIPSLIFIYLVPRMKILPYSIQFKEGKSKRLSLVYFFSSYFGVFKFTLLYG